MTTYFISRHSGAVEWAKQQGIRVDVQMAHLDVTQIQPGDIVIGSLPVNLAPEVCAKNARYFHLTLDLPFNARGVELDAGDMARFDAKLEEYKIYKVVS